jgi:hypothetical protein
LSKTLGDTGIPLVGYTYYWNTHVNTPGETYEMLMEWTYTRIPLEIPLGKLMNCDFDLRPLGPVVTSVNPVVASVVPVVTSV